MRAFGRISLSTAVSRAIISHGISIYWLMESAVILSTF